MDSELLISFSTYRTASHVLASIILCVWVDCPRVGPKREQDKRDMIWSALHNWKRNQPLIWSVLVHRDAADSCSVALLRKRNHMNARTPKHTEHKCHPNKQHIFSYFCPRLTMWCSCSYRVSIKTCFAIGQFSDMNFCIKKIHRCCNIFKTIYPGF